MKSLRLLKHYASSLFKKQPKSPKASITDSVLTETRLIVVKDIKNAEALLSHLENVGFLLKEALKIADLTRLEIHASAEELAKLRQPLADLKPRFFMLECGFCR